MVLLGGLEILAAGYIIREHNKHKRERERIHDEAHRRSRSAPSSARHHSRPRSPPRDRPHRPSGQGRKRDDEYGRGRRPEPSSVVPSASKPQEHYKPASYPSSAAYHQSAVQLQHPPPPPQPYYPRRSSMDEQPRFDPVPPFKATASGAALRRQQLVPTLPDEPLPHPSDMYAELDAGNDLYDYHLGSSAPDLPSSRDERHVRFALPGDGDGTQLGEVRTNTPPPPYTELDVSHR